MAKAHRLLTAAVVLLVSTLSLFSEVPEILDFGTEEFLGANGRLPSIDVDSRNQPHIVCDGGTMAYFYDKVGTTWQYTPFSVSPYRQFYNPHLEISPTDIAWVSGIMVAPGFGFFTRVNMATAPSAPNFSGGYLVQPTWDCGMLSIDPGTPDYMVASSGQGNWDKFIYDASRPGGIRGVEQGQLYAYNGGEKNAFWISKAGNVVHPGGANQAVWHVCTDTMYQNSYRQAAFGFGEYVPWADWNTYHGMWDDGAYPTLVSDLEEPQVAYLVHALSGNGGILVNIWQGNNDGSGQMLRGANNLLSVDPAGSSGLRRYGAQSCAAKGGGAWITWTRDGYVIVMYIGSDGTQGPQHMVAPGAWSDIVADDKGDLHLVYNNNGVRYRKMDVAGAAEGVSFAADFDGNGLDDIAVYRPTEGRWYIFHSGTERQSNVLWGLSEDMPVPANYSGVGGDQIAVYRPSNGGWYIHPAATPVLYGTETDYPVPADYNGDGSDEIAIFRPDTGAWHIRNFWTTPTPSNRIVGWGLPGDIPVPGDYLGNGNASVGVFRPDNLTWYIPGMANTPFGASGDIPAQADYDGDGTTDIAVFRPSNSTWYYLASGSGGAQRTRTWGASGDIPVPGKFVTNDLDSIAVYRPSNSRWYVREVNGAMKIYEPPVTFGVAGDQPIPHDYQGNGNTDIAVFRSSTAQWLIRGVATISYGAPGDRAVPADYDGDGTNDLAVYRPSTGYWYYWSSLSNRNRQIQWGSATDTPVPGKWLLTNRNTMAVWRPSTAMWYIRGGANVQWGAPDDIPVPADYNDDGITDIAVFRPSNGTWYIRGMGAIQFGAPGDIPIPADYNNDGVVDIAVFRPSDGTWYRRNLGSVQFGGPGDRPRPGDYDGDGILDLAVTRGNEGQIEWWVFSSQSGLIRGSAKSWGTVGDIPIGGRQ